jgi:hypothetical protein
MVYERDGGRCLSCERVISLRETHLDHIVPWSAGGPDRSENLRTLCSACNVARSNFRGDMDWWHAKRLPVSFHCVGCVHLDSGGYEVCEPFPVYPEMVPAFCGYCGLVSRIIPEWIL